MKPTTKVRILLVGKLLLIVVFAISFRQMPLYWSNQNTYFLHGLANAGVGFLNLDWLSHTADPFSLFSTLIRVTIQVLSEKTFYFFYITILAIYCYSILGITCDVCGIGNSSVKYLSFFVLLTIWYSSLLVNLLSKVPGLWRFATIFDPNGHLTRGVAGQYILGPIFQPSTFGVFLILSIYLFLRDKPFLAIASLAVAASFHPTYLLSAAVLTCTYMAVIVVKGRNFRKALLIGVVALCSVIPILIYVYLNFNSTTADIYAQALSILVDYRIPHHAILASWFDEFTLFQILVVALSIYLVRHTKLFPVLLVPFLVAMILTIAQILTRNRSLALLFPWRISVFLVPIASSIILASIVSVVFQIFGKPISKRVKPLQVVLLVVITILGYLGVCNTIKLLNAPKVGLTASASFVASTFQHGNLYLIPPDMETFRLAARVPILADFKSHPFKDTEIIEWYNRIKVAEDFYAARGETACSILENISSKYSISHVVMKNDSSIANCEMLHELYKDTDFVIYELSRQY